MLAAPIWYSKWRTPVVADHIMISWFGHHQEHQRSITIQTFHWVRSGHSGVYQHPWLAQKTSETRPQSTRPHQSSLLINLERVMRQSHNTLKPCPMRGIIYKLDTFKRMLNVNVQSVQEWVCPSEGSWAVCSRTLDLHLGSHRAFTMLFIVEVQPNTAILHQNWFKCWAGDMVWHFVAATQLGYNSWANK